jgi:hypothetical protein
MSHASVCAMPGREGSSTHSVVKFIVNVKLIEKRVNNHVGKVMVQKPMVHSRACGRNVTSEVKA